MLSHRHIEQLEKLSSQPAALAALSVFKCVRSSISVRMRASWEGMWLRPNELLARLQRCAPVPKCLG